MSNRIFISYKRSDKKRAFAIKDDIESAVGEKCWIDMEGIESHAQFVNVIIKAIDEADIFLFLYSKRHLNIIDYENDWSVREINYAQSEGKRIIFLNIDGAPLSKWFKLMFGLKQQVDVNSEEAMDKLYVDLRKYLQKEGDNVVRKRKKINFFLRNSIRLSLLLIVFISFMAIYYSTKQEPTLEPENLALTDTIAPTLQNDTIQPTMPLQNAISTITTSTITPEPIKLYKQDSEPKVQASKKKYKVSKNEVKKDTITLDVNGFHALVEKLSQDKRMELAGVLKQYIDSNQFEKAAETVSDWMNKGEIDSTKFYICEVPKAEILKEELVYNVKGIKFLMRFVKGGTFKRDEYIDVVDSIGITRTKKSVETYVIDDFYMAETELTQGLWKAVMGEDISQRRNRVNATWQLKGKGDDMPMYYISYRDCQRFIKELNEILKKELGNKKFGFPTDAQWMFASQGGRKTHHYAYAGSKFLSDVAWFYDNSSNYTHPVATKEPNELGLYDMTGNVWEWCDFANKSINDVYDKDDYLRVMCGGCWSSERKECNVFMQDKRPSKYANDNVGLRLVLNIVK